MSIIDNTCVFSDKQAVTATAASTKRVQVMPHMGKIDHVPLLIQVTEDFAGLTSLKVQVRAAATEGGAYTAVAESDAVPLASLKAGYKFRLRSLPNMAGEWLDLNYVVTGGPATTGKIFACIGAAEQSWYEEAQKIG